MLRFPTPRICSWTFCRLKKEHPSCNSFSRQIRAPVHFIALIDAVGDPLWKGLSIDGRKDLICKIAAIESGFLGMNTTPHIHFRSMQKGTIRYAPFIKKQGFYRPTNGRIYISKDLLLRKTAWSILESLFHELAHACQHSMIQYIQEPHEEKISPFFIQKASIYEQEFQNYCDTNSTTYRQQICEIDAQRFAIETLREYQIIVERIK